MSKPAVVDHSKETAEQATAALVAARVDRARAVARFEHDETAFADVEAADRAVRLATLRVELAEGRARIALEEAEQKRIADLKTEMDANLEESQRAATVDVPALMRALAALEVQVAAGARDLLAADRRRYRHAARASEIAAELGIACRAARGPNENDLKRGVARALLEAEPGRMEDVSSWITRYHPTSPGMRVHRPHHVIASDPDDDEEASPVGPVPN